MRQLGPALGRSGRRQTRKFIVGAMRRPFRKSFYGRRLSSAGKRLWCDMAKPLRSSSKATPRRAPDILVPVPHPHQGYADGTHCNRRGIDRGFGIAALVYLCAAANGLVGHGTLQAAARVLSEM